MKRRPDQRHDDEGNPHGNENPGSVDLNERQRREECAPVDEVDEEPYNGSTKAAATNAALHTNAATVNQNA